MWFRSIAGISKTWNAVVTRQSSDNWSTLSWIHCLQVNSVIQLLISLEVVLWSANEFWILHILSTDFQSYDYWTSVKYDKRIGKLHRNSLKVNKARNYSRNSRRKQKRPQKIHPLTNQTTQKVRHTHTHNTHFCCAILLGLNRNFEFQCSTNSQSRRCTKDSRRYQKCNIIARSGTTYTTAEIRKHSRKFQCQRKWQRQWYLTTTYVFVVAAVQAIKTNRCEILFSFRCGTRWTRHGNVKMQTSKAKRIFKFIGISNIQWTLSYNLFWSLILFWKSQWFSQTIRMIIRLNFMYLTIKKQEF